MRAAQLRAGDTVACNVRGRTFEAIVNGVDRGVVAIDPPRGITYYRVRLDQVTKRLERPHAR